MSLVPPAPIVLKPKTFSVIDTDKRLIKAFASAEIIDLQNELVEVSELNKAMLDYMDRGADVMLAHSNKPVGKVLQWQIAEVPFLENGQHIKGIELIAKIHEGESIYKQAWDDIKAGRITGLSIGAAAHPWKGIQLMKDGEQREVGVLRGLTLHEISLVERPANPLSLVEEINFKAKSLSPLEKNWEEFIVLVDKNNKAVACTECGKPITPSTGQRALMNRSQTGFIHAEHAPQPEQVGYKQYGTGGSSAQHDERNDAKEGYDNEYGEGIGVGAKAFYTLDDIEFAEKALRLIVKRKPKLGSGARFRKLTGKLAKRGVRDPKALAAWIGRRKYGKGKFQHLASAGKSLDVQKLRTQDEVEGHKKRIIQLESGFTNIGHKTSSPELTKALKQLESSTSGLVEYVKAGKKKSKLQRIISGGKKKSLNNALTEAKYATSGLAGYVKMGEAINKIDPTSFGYIPAAGKRRVQAQIEQEEGIREEVPHSGGYTRYKPSKLPERNVS